MCGIAGYHINDPNEQINAKFWLDKSTHYLSHRGPDGEGIQFYNNGQIGFAHTRLSIIDLSHKGTQPMTKGDWVMVFNGEIYNYRTLAGYLNSADDLGTANIGNDAYTLLSYIDKFGLENALNDVSGMFAFSLYNKRTGMIYMAVDHFGQKPLYIAPLTSGIYFASTMAALMHTRQSWQLDHDALETYWMLGATMGRNQLLSGIIKLNGGELLSYNTHSTEYSIRNWYNPKAYIGKVPIEQLIFHAIDETKVSDVPVSIFLSGGIDSTIIASRFQNGTAIHLKSPEQEYAQMVADKFRIKLNVCNPEDYAATDAYMDYILKTGQPTTAGLVPWITSKECAKHTKVAIIANGADELFFGYDRLQGDTQAKSIAQINHTFRGSLFKHERINAYRQKFGLKPSSRLTDLMTFVQYDLNVTLDAASMCHGLEVRSPFLNHTLVEAALSIPENVHRVNGNKTILKSILFSIGFNQAFLNRPKQGFSLFAQPEGLDYLKTKAMDWIRQTNYLSLPKSIPPRDLQYITMSAVGFYLWHTTYSHKIHD